jgi:hypothetical protein
MIAEPEALQVTRNNRSDVYFEALVRCGIVRRLIAFLLPDRKCDDVAKVTHHDERAALVCALTALGIVADKYCAVGDSDGWIILPPRQFIANWAWTHLNENAAEKDGKPLHSTR